MPDFVLNLEKIDRTALEATDARIAAAVARAGCPFCGGPLHVANYYRKPRGGTLAPQCERVTLRFSLCCGREGCRKRVLPPSVRFLGRMVYIEAVVMLACVGSLMTAPLRVAARASQISARTLKRWRYYWREHVPRQLWWAQLRSRLRAPAPDESQLPSSLLAHLQAEAHGDDLLNLAARCLAAATTRLAHVTYFVREAPAMGEQR